MQLPSVIDARLALGAVSGAFESCGGFDELQAAVFDAIARDVYDLDVDSEPIPPVSADELIAVRASSELRHQAVSLMAVLEMVANPLPEAVADAIRNYANHVGVDHAALHAARALAHRHVALMYADFQRSSWYTKQTMKGVLHGQFLELLSSKLAYTGIVTDKKLAKKWLALRECPEGSWGRTLADFYAEHSFPFPGTKHGIYEIGAKHDFVHVLAGYDPSAEGEIDVFGFIAASMPATDGIILLSVTLGLFQNGSIHHVAGKRVKIARSDTLSDPGAIDRFADALRRGALTTVDVMGGIDHFAYASHPLNEVREKFNVVPRADTASNG